MVEKVEIGDATLYLGDSLTWLERAPPCFRVDALITDPPYGVGFKGKVTKHSDERGRETYEDTDDTFENVVLPIVQNALSRADRAAIFTGVRRLQAYPQARDIGGIVCPNGGGLSPWGFGCYHPVLFYGKNPHKGSRPTATVIYHPGMDVTGERNGHPCPKPIAFMEWVVSLASLESHTVFDPFMGSGTTGVACVNLGRKFIGIEINRKYFDIACERIEAAYSQGRLFA